MIIFLMEKPQPSYYLFFLVLLNPEAPVSDMVSFPPEAGHIKGDNSCAHNSAGISVLAGILNH